MDHVESAENSSTSPANTPYLAGHISELEVMHEVAEGELVELARPTVLLSRIKELEIPELDDAKTDPPENHQDNGTTPLVKIQPFLPHSPLEDASVASSPPPSLPRVKAGNAALQAQEGNLPDVRLLSDDYIIRWSNSRRQ